MVQKIVVAVRCNIRQTGEAFGMSDRYQAKLSSENAEIADLLMRLTHNQLNWEFGLCFPHPPNVKDYRWNHKRVYRIYQELDLNSRINPRKRLITREA